MPIRGHHSFGECCPSTAQSESIHPMCRSVIRLVFLFTSSYLSYWPPHTRQPCLVSQTRGIHVQFLDCHGPRVVFEVSKQTVKTWNANTGAAGRLNASTGLRRPCGSKDYRAVHPFRHVAKLFGGPGAPNNAKRVVIRAQLEEKSVSLKPDWCK